MKPKSKKFELPFHVIKRSDIPLWKAMLIRVIAVVAALLLCSVLACGFITYKLCRESPVFCGLVSGAMIEIVFLIAAIFIGRKSTAFPMGLRTVMYIIIIPLSISGALIGNIKFPRKRRRSSARR